MYIWNQTANIITNNNIDKMKEYLIKHLTELITHYVNTNWNDLYFRFINSSWHYVELKQIHLNDVSWDIYSSPLSAMYEDSFGWWEIIFQFSDDYYIYIDIDELKYYQEDYQDLLKDKDKYIKDKVDYIISLTW